MNCSVLNLTTASLLLVVACGPNPGPTGSMGPPGPTGPTGPTGATGTDGRNAVVRVDVEPPGTQCPNGGSVIHSGIDVDDDGVLDAGEIEQSSYVCGGSDGLVAGVVTGVAQRGADTQHANITVTLERTQTASAAAVTLTTTTDLTGAFRFGAVPPGVYDLTAASAGRLTQRRTNLAVLPGEHKVPRMVLLAAERLFESTALRPITTSPRGDTALFYYGNWGAPDGVALLWLDTGELELWPDVRALSYTPSGDRVVVHGQDELRVRVLDARRWWAVPNIPPQPRLHAGRWVAAARCTYLRDLGADQFLYSTEFVVMDVETETVRVVGSSFWAAYGVCFPDIVVSDDGRSTAYVGTNAAGRLQGSCRFPS